MINVWLDLAYDILLLTQSNKSKVLNDLSILALEHKK